MLAPTRIGRGLLGQITEQCLIEKLGPDMSYIPFTA